MHAYMPQRGMDTHNMIYVNPLYMVTLDRNSYTLLNLYPLGQA
jgi:hypothetical protein